MFDQKNRKMEEVKELIRQARQKVVNSDLQGALNGYEEAFQKSQAQQYIAGMFCCSRRLGDIYFISVRTGVKSS